jgi:hypothetical protein
MTLVGASFRCSPRAEGVRQEKLARGRESKSGKDRTSLFRKPLVNADDDAHKERFTWTGVMTHAAAIMTPICSSPSEKPGLPASKQMRPNGSVAAAR